MKNISLNEKNFIIEFDYDSMLVDAVKKAPARTWNPVRKAWLIPAKFQNVSFLQKFAAEHEFEISAKASEKIVSLIAERALTETQRAETAELSKSESAEIEIHGLGGELRPFQRAGVKYALQQKRTFIADEMGLGKTIQALATLQAAEAFPALVVCPASLKFNWEREVRRWLPARSTVVLNGKNQDGMDLTKYEIVILNYDILKKWMEKLLAVQFMAIIYDESHYLKNYKAQRTEAAKTLAKTAKIRLALTGTPLLNRPQELLSQLQILGRLDDLGGFWPFAKRYCGAYRGRFGWDFSGAKNLGELNEKMRAVCYVRRNKADVLKELPAKQRSTQIVEITNRAEYDKAKRDLIAWLSENAHVDADFIESIKYLPKDEQKKAKQNYMAQAAKRAENAEQLVRIETLKQISARGKLEALVEWIESFLETGQKLVLFANHIEIQDALLEKFPDAAKIRGEDSAEARQANVDKFQNDENCKLIICSLAAGGVGITLTAASNVAFVELGWNPAVHDQAEDRLHRIGQSESVNAWYFLARDTIDETIAELIESKRAVVDAATDGSIIGKSVGVLNAVVMSLLEEKI